MSQGVVLCAQAEDMAKDFVVTGSVSSEAKNVSQRDKHRDTCKAMILPVPMTTDEWMISDDITHQLCKPL